MIGSILVLASVVILAVAGHVLLKMGLNQLGQIGFEQVGDPARLVLNTLSNPLLIAALPLYGASFVAWTVVLSRMHLSVAYPALSLTYVVIPFVSWLLLNEPISLIHWIGILLVVAGVLLVLTGGLF